MITFWRTTDYYGCFSNFSRHAIVNPYDGLRYVTMEHYYQAAKFIDPAKIEYVRMASTPKECKQRAYEFPIEVRDWDAVKYTIMVGGLLIKAKTHKFIHEKLLETGSEEIGEASPYDYVWGLGKDNSGQNLLGKAWMDVRSRLQ